MAIVSNMVWSWVDEMIQESVQSEGIFQQLLRAFFQQIPQRHVCLGRPRILSSCSHAFLAPTQLEAKTGICNQ